MRLQRIDQAIETCESHLTSSQSGGTEIEAYLTRYLLILIYASFEEKIYSLIDERAQQSSDLGLGGFLQDSKRQIFRSLKTSEITTFLSRFGGNCKDQFRNGLDKSPRAETFFNNIIADRHETAHSGGSNVSFADLVRFYDESHLVLDAFETAISA